jgi:hypothetical protein
MSLVLIGPGTLGIASCIWRYGFEKRARLDMLAALPGKAGVIEALETEIGMPVITSNQVMAWHVLRRLGLQDQPQGFGRLMALT